MSVAHVTEMTSASASATGFGDAIEKGIERASRTLKTVKGARTQE